MLEDINPFTKKPYSDIAKKGERDNLSNLAAYKNEGKILKEIEENDVLLVISSTSSGKTVIIPRLLLKYFNYDKKVLISMPKKTLTSATAAYVAKTMDVQLGEEIGYKHKGNSKFSEKTKLLFATDGTIISFLLKDHLLSNYNGVILDEAHERKVQIDFLLYLMRELLLERKDFKLIIMSATVNSEIYRRYFEKFKYNLVNISNKTNYEVKIIFSKHKVEDYLTESLNVLDEIIKEKKEGNVLIFVAKIEETNRLCNKIRDKYKNIYCVSLHSKTSENDVSIATQKDKYKFLGDFDRKVIIATEVAESSLTVEDLTFVIDNGKSFQEEYDPVKRAKILETKFITKSQIIQRRGRVGRMSPGVCYHLYTESTFNDLQDYQIPDIKKSNIYEECLKILSTNVIQTVSKLEFALNRFIDPPGKVYIQTAIDQLMELDLIKDGKISHLGDIVIKLGMDVNVAIAMAYSYIYRCSKEMSEILGLYLACNKNIMQIFENNKEKQKEINEKYRKYVSKKGDFMTLKEIYDHIRGKDDQIEYCKKNYIRLQIILAARKDVYKIRDSVFKYKDMFSVLNIDKQIESADITKKMQYCLYMGFKNQIAKNVNNNYIIYTKINNGKQQVVASKESYINFIKSKPKEVFYADYSIVSGKAKISFLGSI